MTTVATREKISLQLNQLKHGSNIREVTPEKIAEMKKSLVINEKIDPINAFILLPPDVDGIYPTHDGNTRLAALKELGYDGKIDGVVVTPEEAADEQTLLTLQYVLGTSNNQLTEIERCTGIVRWVAAYEKKLLNQGMTQAKARAQAIQAATDEDALKVNTQNVRNAIRFLELEDFIKANTKRGLIATVADAVLLVKTYRKLVSDFGSVGYNSTLKEFYSDCLDYNVSRKNGGITKTDIDAAAKVIIEKYAKETLKSEIGNDAIQAAIDAGTITLEGVENLKDKAAEAGISLDEAFEMATEVTEDFGDDKLVTDEDLSLGLREAEKNVQLGTTKEDLGALSDEELSAGIFGSAINLLLTVGGDSNDLVSAVKAALKNYDGITLSDYDRVALEKLFKVARGLDVGIQRTEKNLKAREAKLKKELESKTVSKTAVQDLATALENLENLSDDSLIVEADEDMLAQLPDDFSDEDEDMDTVEADPMAIAADDFNALAEEF